MNNAELFARGNLINQTIKINSLRAEVKERRNKHCDTPLSSPPSLILLQRCSVLLERRSPPAL